MTKRLAVHTHAIGEDGRAVHFSPGDKVPAWAEKQLTNPKLWESAAAPDAEQEPPQTPAAPQSVADPDAVAPPRSGPGSGTAAWTQFAAARGVEVGDKATREDIIAACEAAGAVETE